ncbi:MAG: pyruvate dehydrogenase (acetyl-transferring) E1 component subunit alpha [Gemmatimonadaceae bacterium]|nr:pyruvate dehydrogenase (acetyl-transferring) E1 component subunit alpha [Gemmatimonadaceae bacterium]
MASKKKSPARGEPSTVRTAGDPVVDKELLHSMLLQRRFEEKTGEAYALGKIGGFCHLYIGQEAVSTGIISQLRPDDYVIGTYRDHGQALVRGITPRAVMAELFGRIDGCSRGKGGSMHLFDRHTNFLGGHGIVGSHVPLAAGVGFAIKYRGGDQVCVCFMGDSVVNIGAFHEALNMAALWKLPVLFVIENNRYGMGTAVERAAAVDDLARRADGYKGMDGVVIDGMDVHAVREATASAIARARVESLPSLLEVQTYRFRGHSMSDAVSGTYRSKEELDEYTRLDPVFSLKDAMLAAGTMTAAEWEAMEKDVAATVQDAWDFADASPEPPAAALYEDVLVDTTS